MRKFSPEDYIIQKYADIKFNWHDKNGIGAPYFYKSQKLIKKKWFAFFSIANFISRNDRKFKKEVIIYI